MVDLATLERSAEIILGDPSRVTAEQRREAESLLQSAKSAWSLDEARQILELSQSPFVQHQAAGALGENTVRSWHALSTDNVQSVIRFLLGFVADRQGLANFVASEALRSVAMTLKRGIVDGKAGSVEDILTVLRDWLTSSTPRLQSLGVQLVRTLAEQFSSNWRSARFAITWDFHTDAKQAFDTEGLRLMFEMCLTSLATFAQSQQLDQRLFVSFVDTIEVILTWNFSRGFVFRRLFRSQQAIAFRPPQSWESLVHSPHFLPLFFSLHGRVRQDEELATRALGCLSQLASISGDCMSEDATTNLYLTSFLTQLLTTFGESGPLAHEVPGLCTLLNRLLIYRPIQNFCRLEAVLRDRFFGFFAQLLESILAKTMHDAIADDDLTLVEPLAQLLDAWVILLRGRWRTVLTEEQAELFDRQLVTPTCNRITELFLRCVQSAPYGTRPAVKESSDDEESDDLQLYADVLTPLSNVVVYTSALSLRVFTDLLRARVQQLDSLGDVKSVETWNEDMHWLMLLIGDTLTMVEGGSGMSDRASSSLSADILEASADVARANPASVSPAAKRAFLMAAMTEEPTAQRGYPPDVDPLIVLLAEVLAWLRLEQRLVEQAVNSNAAVWSPQLLASTLFCVTRLVGAMSCRWEDWEVEPDLLPCLPTDEEFQSQLAALVLRKVFSSLRHAIGEEKVCAAAVKFLAETSEQHARALASHPDLYAGLESVPLHAVPVRAVLLRTLVQLGAAAADAGLQQRMFDTILSPLASAWSETASGSDTRPDLESRLVDLLQCFDGVAQAADSTSAALLFRYLWPVLERSVQLLREKASAQTIVAAVLELMTHVTTRVALYLDDKAETARLHTLLLATVDAYCQGQRGRRLLTTKTNANEEDTVAGDLVLFMDMLSNLLSKDLFDLDGEMHAAGTNAALQGLHMLFSIIDDTILQVPEVAIKFFRLILFLSEFSPTGLARTPTELMVAFLRCLTAGLSCVYGVEIAHLALEALGEMVTHFAKTRSDLTQELHAHFVALLPNVLLASLENSCDDSLFAESASCLYALVLLDEAAMRQLAHQLLVSPSNQAAGEQAQQRVAAAFETLLAVPLQATRSSRLQFRSRLEKFVSAVQGCLVVEPSLLLGQ